ncbi:MAG: type II secretion system F family protein [Proteobacteria bacterium]|nr:type II secretion system F family protein [Pseudomonadota bacterium]
MMQEAASLWGLYKVGVLILMGVLIFIVFLINSKKAVRYLDAKFEDRANWLVRELDTLFIDMNKKTALILIYAGTLGTGFVTFIMFLPNFIAGIFIGAAVGFMFSRLPAPMIQYMKNKRAYLFNIQMVDALTLMSNGLRSGLNLIQAVNLVVEEMPDPIRQEFNLLLAQNRIGVPIDEAFVNLSKRLDVEDLDMFATAILILRETGGNLPETFDTIAHTIRERVKLTAKVKSLTAQGVFQAIVITVIPLFMLLVQYFANRDQTMLMFETPVGYIMLFVMFLMQGLGGYMIKKIITIKV